MSNEGQNTRADAVNLLWQFKRLCDARPDLGLPMVHFKMLLEDPAYRTDMLGRAGDCADASVRALVGQIVALNIQGPLSRGLSPSRPKSATEEVHVQAIPASSRGSNAQPVLIIGAALIAIIGLAWLVLKPDTAGSEGAKTVQVASHVQQNTRWEAGNTYVLEGITFVEPGAKLTIDAGVTVKGKPGSALVVTRGASIFARGSADAPIVFTSSKPVGTRSAGDWGGVVLLGDAPLNRQTGHVEGIAESDARGDFGGSNTEGSCGLLEYVRIEFAGYEISRDNELNGLTLGGCGSGTVIRYVQVHRGLDDGIEMFGGNVDLKYAVVSGAGDDAVDWDLGWQGRAQFLVVMVYPNIGDNGFEGDNDGKAMDAEPRSQPTFFNVTMLAEPTSSRVHRGMTLREGTGGRFANFIISGFNGEAVDLRDGPTARLIDSGDLAFQSILLHDNGPDGSNIFADESGEANDDEGFPEADYFAPPRVQAVSTTGLLAGAMLRDPPALVPDAIDLPLAPSRPPQDEFWDEGARYFGAFRPGTAKATPWTAGWTAYPQK